MAELLDYAVAMQKIGDDQSAKVQAAHARLKAAGLRKTEEEAAILCGVLTREQHAALAAEVEATWKVKVPKPNVAPARPEQDEAVAASWRKKGQTEKVDAGLKRQKELRAAGLQVPLWEILAAMGLASEAGTAGPDRGTGGRAKSGSGERPAVAAEPAEGPREGTAVRPRSGVKPAVPRAGSGVKRAVDEAPRKGRSMWVAAGILGGACVVLVVVIVIVIMSRNGGAPSPTPTPTPASTPTPTPAKPPPPEADEIYMLQDRINARGLWALVQDLRGRTDQVKKMHEAMEADLQTLRDKIQAAVAHDMSVPVVVLQPTDELTSVEGLQVWADSKKYVEASYELEKLLRKIVAGQTVRVGMTRARNHMKLDLSFRATPNWPDPK